MAWKLSKTPLIIRIPANCLGEYNEYVLGSLLGLSQDELAQLGSRPDHRHGVPPRLRPVMGAYVDGRWYRLRDVVGGSLNLPMPSTPVLW